MNIIITILLVLAGIIALLLIIALFMKKKHYVKREIIINAPRQKVFDHIKLLKNQDEFNKHAMTAPDRNREFKGTDGTVGYIYAWSGNKNAGEGEKEIMNIIEGEKIETEIRFVKPMTTRASIIMETESLSDNQTKLIWSNAGRLKYPINIMIPMMEKHVVKDMDISLSTLKNILEKWSNLDKVVSDFGSKGFAVISSFDTPIAKIVFFDTRKEIGVFTEIMGITKEGEKAVQEMKIGMAGQ